MKNTEDPLEHVKEDVEDIPKKSGPAGLLVILIIAIAVIGIIVLGSWLLFT